VAGPLPFAYLDLTSPGGVALAILALLLLYVLAWWGVFALRDGYGRLRMGAGWIGWWLYRFRLFDGKHLPARGPALLVCNPVTYVDWLYLIVLLPRRVTFLLPAPAYGQGTWARAYLRWAGVLAVDDDSDDAAIERLFAAARQRLAEGGVVCVFTQTWRTKDGQEYPVSRVLAALDSGNAPIVPLCFEQEWGSAWREGDDRWHWKSPAFLGETVDLSVGEPLPAGTPPGEVVAAVNLLAAKCDVARNKDRPTPHRRFIRLASRQPNRPCLYDGMGVTPELNYGKAGAAAIVFSKLLKPLLGGAKLVGLWLPPSPGAILSNIALALLGKASVNLNYTAGTAAIHSAIRQTGLRHVLTSRRFVEKMKLELPPGVEPIYLEDVRAQVTKSMQVWNYLLIRLLPGWVLEHWVLGLGGHTNDDLATVIFSSGSTGEPKGVMLTFGNIAANIESAVHSIHLDRRDRLLAVLPTFHSFGYTITLWAPLNVGASTVYYPDPRAAGDIGALCKKHRSTVFLSTATFLRFCLRKCEPDAFRSLRVLICGAEKLPVPLQEEFLAKFGVPAMEGYGCTELSPAAATNMPEQGHGGLKLIGNRPGTIGPPLQGCAARIVDPETMQTLPIGADGLLLMYGANVMKGYLGRDDLTKKVKIDGWYVTGDMGRIDADGYVTLTGRQSRFAKVGGEMVPLELIEAELQGVANTDPTDGRVCVVTCVPDPTRGERVVVLYKESVGLDVPAWLKRLAGRGLPALWVPAERDFYPIVEIPVSGKEGMSKPDLVKIKELAQELARR